MNEGLVLGVVRNGQLNPVQIPEALAEAQGLTRISAQTPDVDGVDLSEYEGQAVMVRGDVTFDDWITEAEIVDSIDPIMTVLLVHLLDSNIG